jgi:predicted CDP-diglyceride synthetase/phosphatidate cytidylyltransferase
MLALGASVAIAGLAALWTRRRGGRFRGLPGWAGFWVVFALLLVCLSRATPWVSFPLLAALMFAALRAYFFLAPIRPADRRAVIAAYVAIPLVLYPIVVGAAATFLVVVPVSLFLLMPLLIALGPPGEGLLDAIGRTLLAVLLFIFCTAHLGLLVREAAGLVELFGVLVIWAELAQRLIGRFRPRESRLRPLIGLLVSGVLAHGLGFWLGPQCGVSGATGGRAGLLVALAVAAGAVVNEAVARDLDLSSSTFRLGRGALLDRTIPAVYAAPVFYHYLITFAPR